MSKADEWYNEYLAEKDKGEDEKKKTKAEEWYAEYKKEKASNPANTQIDAQQEEESTPHSSVSFTSRVAPMLPNAAIIDSQLNHEANQKAVEKQRYIESSPSVSAAPQSQTKYPTIEADYQKKVADITTGTQDKSVKDSYLAEAQLEREVKMLEERARNQAIIDRGMPGITTPQKSAFNNGRTSAIQNTDSEELTKANELLEEKRKQLASVQRDNEIYRVFDDPELSQDLEAMYANRDNPEVTKLYGQKIAEKGYDTKEVLKRYTTMKSNETLSNPEVYALVGAMAEDEKNREDTALLSMLNPSYTQSKSLSSAVNAAGGETTFSKAVEARQKLIEMGYNPDELLEQYTRNQNKNVSESLNQEFREFGSKHPVLGTLASFPANLGSGMGVAELAKAALTGREVDPNSPYFTYLNMTQNMRQGASGGMDSKSKFAYDISTTIGDMVLSRLVTGGSSTAYSAVMASQVAGSTVQDGAQKGYSAGHIFINATAAAALTAVCENMGYDKVFNPQYAGTAKDLFKNVYKGFMAEGLEEASEEALNTVVENITSAIFNGQTDVQARIEELVAQGMSREQAHNTAIEEIAEQVGTSFVMGGIAGGIMAGGQSMPGYVVSTVERNINKKLKTPESDIQPPATDAQNEPNLPSETDVETASQTVPTAQQNAENEAISADTDSVSTTVDENGVEWFEFDDDTDFDAVDEELKSEYNAEETAGLTEKVEPYTSGNSSVDALVNTNGRLDRKITINEQAQQRIIDIAQRFFGRKVRFVDNISNANGFFDKETSEIILSKTSSLKELTLFGHEFAHTLEGTHEYRLLTTHLRHNSQYIKSQLADVKGDWDTLVQNKITEYENALGKTLSKTEAEFEIYADAIANELFTDYNAIEKLATQNQSVFTRLKQWFARNFIGTREQTTVLGTKAAARKTYALMLKAEKAAMNTNLTSNQGKVYSLGSYTQNQKNNWSNSKRIITYESDEQLNQFVDESVVNKSYDKKMYFGTIPAELADLIQRQTGISVENYNLSLASQEIRKILRDHGNEQTETLRGQRAATKEDLANIPKVIQAPDSIILSNETYYDKPVILFTKNLNGKNTVVAVVSDKHHDLFVQTAYFGIKKESLAPPLDTNQVPNITSKTSRGTAFNNSISDSAKNVNNQFSAKPSEVAQRITENFGYTETTANNIVRAARTLKQKTGSKADVNELAYTIASTLESRRNGNTDSRDAERIAMMIADDTKAVNEDYIETYKPILDRLNGMKISISEADISDLGDAFSYVKQRLFPYVTLTKGTESSIDSVFQDLATDYPRVFDANAVTHPGDQVRAIMGFIEDYRNNRYFKPYFEDSEAFASLREDVETLLGDTTIDEDTYLNKLAQLVEKNGEIKNGVPQSTDGKTRVRGAIASFYGTKPIISNPELSARYAKDIVNGKYDYTVMRIGKKAKQYLDNIKASENVTQTVADEYKRIKSLFADKNYRLTPTDIMQAAALNPLLGEVLTDDDYVEYTTLVAEVGTTAGQIISSLRLISQFSGAQKLKAYKKKIDKINQKQSRQYQGDIESGAVADENGQFKMADESLSEDIKKPKGVYEFIVTKKRSKYPPIEIPAELEQKLAKAKTQDEIDKATDELNKYLAEQIHYSWLDKFNAWRYFAMLSNPKTAIRNTVGNVAMSGVSRAKDALAAGLSRLPVAKGYKDGDVQTTAAVTTKEARQAATKLLAEDDTVMSLFSRQDKYTGRLNEFESGNVSLNKAEQKLADGSPLLGVILNNRTTQPTALSKSKVPILGKALGKASEFQQKMLDDTPYKVLRAKSVLSQSITTAVRKGEIANLNDFIAVALNQNTDHLDNATKIKYAQLYETFCKQAAKEGDESTFRDDNALADKVNKLRQGDKLLERIGAVVVDGFIPFVKTPANIVKRGVEYSPIGLGKTAIADRYKLAKGDIDRNTYINNLAKGLTGTIIFALGALLSSLGVLSVGDDDEEDEAERKLLNGQEYAIDFGDSSYSIEFLTPAALPLFMGGKVYETIVNASNGDEIKATEFIFDILQGVAEPMFAQTMLSGIDGAFEAVSRETRLDDSEGASAIAVLSYCTENWVNQFVPSVLGATARTLDDTTRSYYTEKGKDEGILQNLMVGIKKKIPGAANTTPAKLDMWGQPIKSGDLSERLIENFISPGYYEEDTSDRATKALHSFATNNDIPYTEIIPEKVPNYFTLPNKETINLTAEEYEKYASIVGRARKEAVEKYLVRGEAVEIEYNYTVIKSSLKNGKKTEKRTFRGNIATATNRYGWASTKSADGYIQFDDDGKAVGVTAASDEEFRKMLFEEVMKQVTDEAEAEAQDLIMQAHNNK